MNAPAPVYFRPQFNAIGTPSVCPIAPSPSNLKSLTYASCSQVSRLCCGQSVRRTLVHAFALREVVVRRSIPHLCLTPEPGPGRKPGIPNKANGLLKDAIIQAAEAAGGSEGIVAVALCPVL